MKNILFTCLALLCLAGTAHSQVTPNSNRFDVEKYIAIDNTGRYYPYTVHGFYENAAPGATPRIYLMPVLKLDLNKIKFIDNHGIESTQSDENIRSIIIPVSIDLLLPNESQKAAIVAAIKGHTTIQAFYPPIVKNGAGVPVVNPVITSNPVLYNQIMQMAGSYEANLIFPQQQLINDYNTRYKAEIISLTEVEVILEAGGEVVYSKRIPGTLVSTGGTLKNIVLENPTEYVKNLVGGGNCQVLVSYKFKDSKSSTISANINASTVVNQFLSEAYKSSVSQSSSGWSFLGFGSSKRSIKSSFDQQINQQYSANSIANTTIEMYDADDKMIEEFENTFFPKITLQDAIQKHLDAAARAKTEGNTKLEELHLKYVDDLRNNNPNLTPNIEAAVAALGKEDYIGFIAHGIRWGSNSGSGNNSYRRTLTSSEMTSQVTNWNQTKVVSLHHAVSQPVTVSQEVKYRPSLGFIDGIPYQGSLWMFNGFATSLQNVNGVFIGPITVGGAFHQNNIAPGTLMTKIGPYPVYSGQTITDALSHYKRGDKVYVTLILPAPMNPNFYQEQRVQVTLGAYPVTSSDAL